MTKQETCDYLLRVRKLQRQIWLLCLRHDELQSCLLPAAIRYDKDVVQTSPEDKLSDVAAAVLDIEAKIRQLQHYKARAILEVSAIIDKIDNETERAILNAYYVGRISMKKISEEIGYSLSHTYNLRSHGIKSAGDILDER